MTRKTTPPKRAPRARRASSAERRFLPPQDRWRKTVAGRSTGGWSKRPVSGTTPARCSRRRRRSRRWRRERSRPPRGSAFAIGRAEHVGLGRQHHVVERLGKHRGRKEGHGAQRFRADIGKIVPHRGRKHEHAAGPYLIVALFGAQLALAGDDVLGLLGGVGVPAELAARLDLVDDGGGLG